MDKEKFIEKTPYLYHLTDRRNLESIYQHKKILSTTELVSLANIENAENFLRQRRPLHTNIKANGYDVFIRDQRPLNRALNNCLTDNWTPEDYIYHLNRRVFMWPTLKRLWIHYGRYESENPIILRFSAKEILELNNHAEITNINSGATRPSGALGGKAAARGKDTFKKFEVFDLTVSKVAEVTFPEFCLLPNNYQKANNPDGPWQNGSF